jgi:hypothetical protein
MIFIISFFLCLLTLIVERAVGIDWDFHVDSVTYVESMDYFKFSEITSLYDISNNLHYYVVSLLGINGTILYNIFLTAAGNQIIYSTVINKTKYSLKIFLILYLFNPYKLHLSTTLLKDSAIIFFLILALFIKFNLIGIFFGVLYRNAFLFYLIYIKLLRRFYIYVFICVLILYFYATGFSLDTFNYHLSGGMTFRDFDLIPNFTQFGSLVGGILRMVVWPLITISGLFFLISPTLAYFPLFIGSISLVLVYGKIGIKIRDLAPFIILLSFFALIVPGYTTYYRYVFPVIALLPYIYLHNKHRI